MRVQEESPAGPLVLVGWWDQRKTQETFHTSIKTCVLPLFSWPSIPSLPEAVLLSTMPSHPAKNRWSACSHSARVCLVRSASLLLPLGLHPCPVRYWAMPEEAPVLLLWTCCFIRQAWIWIIASQPFTPCRILYNPLSYSSPAVPAFWW